MGYRTRVSAVGVAAISAASLAFVGSASAAFPDFTGCPSTSPGATACVDIQSQSGSVNIKGFNVPLGHSLEIRGALAPTDTGSTFFPAAGTNGFIAQPVQVPGGLLGIDLPLSINMVTATAALAGPSSAIQVDPNSVSISMPIKLELSNPLLGPGCQIGSNSNPVHVTLITGTTNPPAPNRPITGTLGSPAIVDGNFVIAGNTNVDNAFSIPGASNCGLGLGLINAVVNAKLKLPSAGGNNSMSIDNDVALQPIIG